MIVDKISIPDTQDMEENITAVPTMQENQSKLDIQSMVSMFSEILFPIKEKLNHLEQEKLTAMEKEREKLVESLLEEVNQLDAHLKKLEK